MSISNISSLFSAQGIQSTTPGAQSPSGVDSTTPAPGVAVDISKPGQLFSELSSLAQSDPDKFKSVAADIAKQLKDAASQAGGPDATFLNKLADRFTAASQSGNVADLKPDSAQGAGHHRGGHGGHHRVHDGGSAEQFGAPGTGPNDGIASTVQNIISNALTAASSAAATST